MRIKVQPIGGAEPLMCIENVRKRIKAMGGSAVYGWQVKTYPLYNVHLSHVVWCSPDGELQCVTPSFTGEIIGDYAVSDWAESIEFLPDETATFEGKALPCKYVAAIDNPYMRRACEYMQRADNLMADGELDKCRHWTNKANAECKRGKLTCWWDTPASLMLDDVLATIF